MSWCCPPEFLPQNDLRNSDAVSPDRDWAFHKGVARVGGSTLTCFSRRLLEPRSSIAPDLRAYTGPPAGASGEKPAPGAGRRQLLQSSAPGGWMLAGGLGFSG